MSLYAEILEQPDCVQRLLQSQRTVAEEIARAISGRDIHYVFIAARGTSDNAGRYATYLWGAVNGLPVALAAPSLFTSYRQPPRLREALVVGISQSGMSPDIVTVLDEGRRQGCLTLAITNAVDSPLAQAADMVLDIQAGPETAVAATKTYTAELMGIAMLSAALAKDASRWDQLADVPERMDRLLAGGHEIEPLARRLRPMRQCVVLGRGYNYATAFEWALKLKELSYVEAEPYSSADFQHGPIAMMEGQFPVLAVVTAGEVYQSMMELLRKLHEGRAAELVVMSDTPEALSLAQTSLALPPGTPEWLTPLVSIVPAQLFTYHLTRTKGYDTESPRGIQKVTETR